MRKQHTHTHTHNDYKLIMQAKQKSKENVKFLIDVVYLDK